MLQAMLLIEIGDEVIFKIRKFPCPWPFEKLGQCFLIGQPQTQPQEIKLTRRDVKYFDTSADFNCQGLGSPEQRSVHMLYLWTSKGGVSTAGDNLAQSTVEDGEGSRMSEKAAEGKAESQTSSFVTRLW